MENEKAIKKMGTRQIAVIGMLSAISILLGSTGCWQLKSYQEIIE